MARKNNKTMMNQPWNLMNPSKTLTHKKSSSYHTLMNSLKGKDTNMSHNSNDINNNNISSSQDIISQHSNISPRTSHTPTPAIQHPTIYAALLSRIAIKFRQRIVLSDHTMDEIDFKNTFDGREAIDKLAQIIGTSDRKLALRVGIALSDQRLFHDVCYETQLVDSPFHLYEFSNIAFYSLNHTQRKRNDSWSECGSIATSQNDVDIKDFQSTPNGVITELTYCYVPTCLDQTPCYSPCCPKRTLQTQTIDFKEDFLEKPVASYILSSDFLSDERPANLHDHNLWADVVDKNMYESISPKERKRQENIYELIYTEKDYVHSLEYLIGRWIQPLSENSIIATARRDTFIYKVFGEITTLHRINSRLLQALESRQKNHPIVYQIGDVILDCIIDFEPYIKYGSKQYEAKFALENERFINPDFDAFVDAVERHVSSNKLELNGYLTKPTTRLGRYPLLFSAILKNTPEGHPDQVNLTKAISRTKQLLSRVNSETGRAKTRYDLERIHHNLSFKYKADEVNLDLLNKDREIIKQGILKRTGQLDSAEYQVILFDHYLVVFKMKISGGIERYVVQKRPIPVELLSVSVPDHNFPSIKRASTLLPSILNSNSNSSSSLSLPPIYVPSRASTDIGSQLFVNSHNQFNTNKHNNYYPILIEHLGSKRNGPVNFYLYATAPATRKSWLEKIKIQQEVKNSKSPVFELVPILPLFQFTESVRINHFITFNGGNQYLIATDDGVYVGHYSNCIDKAKRPHKLLSLDRVLQIQVIEVAEVLLVLLGDKTLWEYNLDVVNGDPEHQAPGRLIQTNVPFFCVGQCLQKTLLCVPRILTLKSYIYTYESIPKVDTAINITPSNKRHLIPEKLWQRSSQDTNEIHFKRVKESYIPSEAYALELSATMMLITSANGVIMVDMRTDKAQSLLNASDKNLAFILEKEMETTSPLNLKQPVKRIAIFKTGVNEYFVCYDEFAFYIDKKGNRLKNEFLIEWEGCPERFAFSYPYVMAFDASFIEVRNIKTGSIDQIIRGKQMKCLNNGHKSEMPLIFGTMIDPMRDSHQFVFVVQSTENVIQNVL